MISALAQFGKDDTSIHTVSSIQLIDSLLDVRTQLLAVHQQSHSIGDCLVGGPVLTRSYESFDKFHCICRQIDIHE